MAAEPARGRLPCVAVQGRAVSSRATARPVNTVTVNVVGNGPFHGGGAIREQRRRRHTVGFVHRSSASRPTTEFAGVGQLPCRCAGEPQPHESVAPAVRFAARGLHVVVPVSGVSSRRPLGDLGERVGPLVVGDLRVVAQRDLAVGLDEERLRHRADAVGLGDVVLASRPRSATCAFSSLAKPLASDSMSLASTPSTTKSPGCVGQLLPEQRELLAARMAVRRPEVEHDRLARVVGEAHRLAVERRQREVGRGVADAWAHRAHAFGHDRRTTNRRRRSRRPRPR